MRNRRLEDRPDPDGDRYDRCIPWPSEGRTVRSAARRRTVVLARTGVGW